MWGIGHNRVWRKIDATAYVARGCNQPAALKPTYYILDKNISLNSGGVLRPRDSPDTRVSANDHLSVLGSMPVARVSQCMLTD